MIKFTIIIIHNNKYKLYIILIYKSYLLIINYNYNINIIDNINIINNNIIITIYII